MLWLREFNYNTKIVHTKIAPIVLACKAPLIKVSPARQFGWSTFLGGRRFIKKNDFPVMRGLLTLKQEISLNKILHLRYYIKLKKLYKLKRLISSARRLKLSKAKLRRLIKVQRKLTLRQFKFKKRLSKLTGSANWKQFLIILKDSFLWKCYVQSKFSVFKMQVPKLKKLIYSDFKPKTDSLERLIFKISEFRKIVPTRIKKFARKLLKKKLPKRVFLRRVKGYIRKQIRYSNFLRWSYNKLSWLKRGLSFRNSKRFRRFKRNKKRRFSFNRQVSRIKLLRRFASVVKTRVFEERPISVSSRNRVRRANKRLLKKFISNIDRGDDSINSALITIGLWKLKNYMTKSSSFLKMTQEEKMAYLDKLNLSPSERIRLLKL